MSKRSELLDRHCMLDVAPSSTTGDSADNPPSWQLMTQVALIVMPLVQSALGNYDDRLAVVRHIAERWSARSPAARRRHARKYPSEHRALEAFCFDYHDRITDEGEDPEIPDVETICARWQAHLRAIRGLDQAPVGAQQGVTGL